jgi:hypothetical protein
VGGEEEIVQKGSNATLCHYAQVASVRSRRASLRNDKCCFSKLLNLATGIHFPVAKKKNGLLLIDIGFSSNYYGVAYV